MALENLHDCAKLVEAIDFAKEAGIQTADASAMLVQWQNYGRNILIQARMSQSPQIIHEALDETRRMGLVSLLEWKVCHFSLIWLIHTYRSL